MSRNVFERVHIQSKKLARDQTKEGRDTFAPMGRVRAKKKRRSQKKNPSETPSPSQKKKQKKKTSRKRSFHLFPIGFGRGTSPPLFFFGFFLRESERDTSSHGSCALLSCLCHSLWFSFHHPSLHANVRERDGFGIDERVIEINEWKERDRGRYKKEGVSLVHLWILHHAFPLVFLTSRWKRVLMNVAYLRNHGRAVP